MTKPNTFPPGRFKKLWANEDMTLHQIADIAGYQSHKSVIAKARTLGLPPRPLRVGRPPFVNSGNRAEFERLVAAGIPRKAIARRFGVTQQAVSATIARLGLGAPAENTMREDAR